MSLEALREMGLLRPERAWDGRQQRTGVPVAALGAAALIGAAGCAAIVVGDGGPTTWFGVALFLVGLFGFIGLNLWGVGRRRRSR